MGLSYFHINLFKVSLSFKIMAKKEKIKMAVIAGASYAIRYKEEHPNASESETMS